MNKYWWYIHDTWGLCYQKQASQARTSNRNPQNNVGCNYITRLRYPPQSTKSTCIDKQRFLTPGHQGWNDLHRLCCIGMEYYLPNNDNNSNNNNNNDNDNNNDNNNNKTMMMMIIIIIIRMMTMMIIGTTTIMIMIIIITTTLTMTIMKMIMIKTAQTPCQSLYKDRRIQNKIAWYNWYNRNDIMLILYEMLHNCSIMHTQWRCKFENTKHRCLGMFLHKCNLHCSGRYKYKRGLFFQKLS